MRKETVDIDILVASRNGDRKIMQSIRIMLPQSWACKQNVTAVVVAVMIAEVSNNWWSVLRMNILKKIRLQTKITFHYRKCMLPVQYLSDWCLHGMYVWHKFQRKNISINWSLKSITKTDYSNLGSFGYFKCSTGFWLLLNPSCRSNLLTWDDWGLQTQIVTWRVK